MKRLMLVMIIAISGLFVACTQTSSNMESDMKHESMMEKDTMMDDGMMKKDSM